MDAEVCAALSLDLAALWAPSSMSILPPVSTPPSAYSGGGGSDADGAVAPEAFFFGGMSVKTMKIQLACTPDRVRTISTPPTWRARDVGEADSTNTYGDRAPFGSVGGGGRTKSGSRQ